MLLWPQCVCVRVFSRSRNLLQPENAVFSVPACVADRSFVTHMTVHLYSSTIAAYATSVALPQPAYSLG